LAKLSRVREVKWGSLPRWFGLRHHSPTQDDVEAIFRVELTVSTTSIIKPLRSIHSNTSMDPNDRQPMTGTARDDASAVSEQDELISCLERIQESFERRALSSMAEPLISTPVTMQQLKVLTMIAIDPDKATGHELAAQLKVSVATMSGLVDRLVEHGMVSREEDPSDRRVRRLNVTSEGSATIRSLLSSSGTMPTPVLRRLAIEDLRALVRGVLAFDRAVRELADGDPVEE
jgi:DNA-binding MarR family transcriptional regulator